jgi:hypothetical protein
MKNNPKKTRPFDELIAISLGKEVPKKQPAKNN